MHTPGPWTIRKGSYGALHVGPATLPHPGKESVAYSERCGGPDLLAWREADAAIIGASLDMLTVLRDFVAAWDRFDEDGPAPFDDMVTRARAAIAKAESRRA